MVGAAFLGWRLLARRPGVALARTPALYAIGSIAAYWTLARVAALLG